MKFILEIIRARKKSFLAIIGLLAANVLLYAFIANFQQSRLGKLRDEWLDKRRQSPAGKIDKARVYNQGKKDLDTFNSRVPPKRQFTRVVGELYEMASSNGLSIGSVGYKPELIKDRDILVYTLTFSVTGGYAAIKSFISDIERSREMLAIDHISLSRADISPDSVKFSIIVSAFFKAEKP
ncbi:MAG: hypothetical protein H6Q57_1106 [Geobacteraceae bacterium]|jgi:type IV pilus assembly protein PilO|nr:hypothetical protein [Geobacteraceae bacterium]